MNSKRKLALLCGMLGCLCYGGGDWLMMYGDPTYTGSLIWLTTGTAQIPLWRYDLAMALGNATTGSWEIGSRRPSATLARNRRYNGEKESGTPWIIWGKEK